MIDGRLIAVSSAGWVWSQATRRLPCRRKGERWVSNRM